MVALKQQALPEPRAIVYRGEVKRVPPGWSARRYHQWLEQDYQDEWTELTELDTVRRLYDAMPCDGGGPCLPPAYFHGD